MLCMVLCVGQERTVAVSVDIECSFGKFIVGRTGTRIVALSVGCECYVF